MHHFTKCSLSKLKIGLESKKNCAMFFPPDPLVFSIWTKNQHCSGNTVCLIQNGCLGLKEAVSQSSSNRSSSNRSSSVYRAKLLPASLFPHSYWEKINKLPVKHHLIASPPPLQVSASHQDIWGLQCDPQARPARIILWKCNPGLGAKGIKALEDTM